MLLFPFYINYAGAVMRREGSVLGTLDLLQQDTEPPAQFSCDVTFQNSLCLKNGQHIILPPARSDGLAARYLFDSGFMIDASGNAMHGTGIVYPGPSPFGGTGYSGAYRRSATTVPQFQLGSSATREWAFGFWLFLLEGSQAEDTVCPVVSRGAREASNPSIGVNPSSGRIRVTIATTLSGGSGTAEYFESNARLREQTWYRISVVRQAKRVILYVNGVRDSFLDFKGELDDSEAALYVGTTEEAAVGACDMPFLIDDLSVWNANPGSLFIEAEGAVALGPVEPSRIELSCSHCTKTEAEEGCSNSFHLCGDWELANGVLQAADLLGWTRSNKAHSGGPNVGISVYTTSTNSKTDTGSAAGVGICCRD